MVQIFVLRLGWCLESGHHLFEFITFRIVRHISKEFFAVFAKVLQGFCGVIKIVKNCLDRPHVIVLNRVAANTFHNFILGGSDAFFPKVINNKVDCDRSFKHWIEVERQDAAELIKRVDP